MPKQLHNSDSRRGAVMLFAALLLIFLVTMAAYVVDVGYLCCVQTNVQAVADAAALYGAQGLVVSPAQVRANAQACAQMNKVNAQPVVLQSSDIVLGNWSTTNRTFTVLTGAAEAGANACQVNVSLTAARNNPVHLFFGPVIGQMTKDMTASAISGANRWDVIVSQDISGSYSADLPYAVQGSQDLVDAFNKFSPTSLFGVVQHTGWGSTWAPLQVVGTNYSTLRASIGNMHDADNPTPGTKVNGGGPGITPPTSGSDLSTGIQTAISMFSAPSYTAITPVGTRQAIIINSDGASNATSTGQHPSPTYTNAQLDTLTQQAASAAWAQGISVFVLLYYHGSDTANDTAVLKSLVRGQGTFVQVTDPTQVPVQLQSIFFNNLLYTLKQ